MDPPHGPKCGQHSSTGNDFLDNFQLDVTFSDSGVRQQRHFSDRTRGLRNVVEVKTWKRSKELGRGGFGIVYLEDDGCGNQRAVKEVPKSIGKGVAFDPLREITAMAAFSKNEAHFVQLEGWFQNNTHLYIAMEYFQLGDLQNCMVQPVSEPEAQDIMFQLNEAICFMHARGFTHRDLKPANVFVVSNSPFWWVKLADLGISKRVQGDSTGLCTTFDGSFMAPEILGFGPDTDAGQYTKAVDMWALGSLAYWLLTLQNPVPRKSLLAICSGKKGLSVDKLDSCSTSSDGVDYITSLVKVDASQRMEAFTALKHPWIRGASLPTIQTVPNEGQSLAKRGVETPKAPPEISRSYTSGDLIDKVLTSIRNYSFSKDSDPTEQQDGKVDEAFMEQFEIIARVEPETAQVSRTRAAQNQAGRNNSANISHSNTDTQSPPLKEASRRRPSKQALAERQWKSPPTHLRSSSSIRGQAHTASEEKFDDIPYTPETCSKQLEDDTHSPDNHNRTRYVRVEEDFDYPSPGDSYRRPDLTKDDGRMGAQNRPRSRAEELRLQGSEHSRTDHGSVQTHNSKSNNVFLYPPSNGRPHSLDHSAANQIRVPSGNIRQDLQARTDALRVRFYDDPRNESSQPNKLRDKNPRSNQSGLEPRDSLGSEASALSIRANTSNGSVSLENYDKPKPPAPPGVQSVVHIAREIPFLVTLEELFTGRRKPYTGWLPIFSPSKRQWRAVHTTVYLEIKPGMKEGSKIPIPGSEFGIWHYPVRGSRFTIVENKHPAFTRDGDNLRTRVVASRGYVNTICGKTLNIPTNIHAEQILEFAGFGMPLLTDPTRRGNLIVTIIGLLPPLADQTRTNSRYVPGSAVQRYHD